MQPSISVNFTPSESGLFENRKPQPPETGPAAELSLRVSGACLTLLLVKKPAGGGDLAVLERVVRCPEDGAPTHHLQPVGGAVTVLNPGALAEHCGPFNFDSPRAAEERDLRIFVKPEAWPKIRAQCAAEFEGEGCGLIETTPHREIQEEVGDPLGEGLRRDQYELNFKGCVFQDAPRGAARAGGRPTVRFFAVYEARVRDEALSAVILKACAAADLGGEIERAGNLPSHKAVSLAAVPLDDLVKAVAETPAEKREGRIPLGREVLADNVYAVVLHRLSAGGEVG